MEYTLYILGFLGVAGILLHNLVSMDKQNRDQNGNLSFRQYLLIERFSIIISLLVVSVALVLSQEIKRLAGAGYWLGLGFVALGYFAQSLLIWIMARTKDKITKQ